MWIYRNSRRRSVMSDMKTVGAKVDKAVAQASKKIEKVKDRVVAAKDAVVDIAVDISKSVKKAVVATGEAVSDFVRK
jgi:hypothetical protein